MTPARKKSGQSERDCRCKPTRGSLLYRCRHGNVWLDGVLHCSVPVDRSAVAVLGHLSASAPVGREEKKRRAGRKP